MKTKLFLGSLICLFSLLIISCGKDDSTPSDEKGDFIKMKINGVDRVLYSTKANWSREGTQLEFTGIIGEDEFIEIKIGNTTTKLPAGEYNTDQESPFRIIAFYRVIRDNVKITYSAINQSDHKEDYFEIKIDKITNDHVEGTFSGTLIRHKDRVMLDKTTITNGKFSLTIEPFK
ncbi:hypothetical protein [Sphingobacterium kyonggiense]